MFILQLIFYCGLQKNLGSTVKKSKIKKPLLIPYTICAPWSYFKKVVWATVVFMWG
jgi:hypothetical protein